MRIAFLFDPKMVRVPFDVENLWTSPRGLTGSEVTFFRLSAEMAKRGHEVVAFSKLSCGSVPGGFVMWNGVKCAPYYRWTEPDAFVEGLDARKAHWDAAVSYISADPLRYPYSLKTFRVVHQQCRGWSMSTPGWENYVDLVCALSNVHAGDLVKGTEVNPREFRILHNGVDLDEFNPGKKVPGRVIYASSPERGLHRLLECWPRIRAQAPHAHLRVFYDPHCLDNTPDPENRARAAYIKTMLPRLARHGVEAVGSVSREKIAREMAEAEVLAYPLETTELVETFGSVVVESMAAGCIPVLCLGDAFGELWGEHAVGIGPPIAASLHQFSQAVGAVLLSGQAARESMAIDCMHHASKFSWPRIADGLERCLMTRGKEGLREPKWTD